MSSDDHEWLVWQAGEYVLGTLEEDAERELTARLQYDTDLQRLVLEWQERLQPLANTVEPVMPPARVWSRLSRQIEMRISERYPAVTELESARRSRRRQTRSKLVAWQWIGSLAIAASAVLAVALWQSRVSEPANPFDTVSVVSSDEAGALWVVNASVDAKQIRITAIAPPDIDEDQDHELWIVLPNEQGVRSLGALPRIPNTSITKPAPQLQGDAVAFAVSLEPAGGSPEDVPTGPVLYQGAFNRIKDASF